MTRVDPLAASPFSFRLTKSGHVQIFYQETLVTTLAGQKANRFILKVESLDPRERQLLMAKSTGNFKHGNERMSQQRRGNR